MPLKSVNQCEPERFAVYAGDGAYLSGLGAFNDGRSASRFVQFAGLDKCLNMARAEAVAACHAARRAGVAAWIVRNPATALA